MQVIGCHGNVFEYQGYQEFLHSYGNHGSGEPGLVCVRLLVCVCCWYLLSVDLSTFHIVAAFQDITISSSSLRSNNRPLLKLNTPHLLYISSSLSIYSICPVWLHDVNACICVCVCMKYTLAVCTYSMYTEVKKMCFMLIWDDQHYHISSQTMLQEVL